MGLTKMTYIHEGGVQEDSHPDIHQVVCCRGSNPGQSGLNLVFFFLSSSLTWIPGCV